MKNSFKFSLVMKMFNKQKPLTGNFKHITKIFAIVCVFIMVGVTFAGTVDNVSGSVIVINNKSLDDLAENVEITSITYSNNRIVVNTPIIIAPAAKLTITDLVVEFSQSSYIQIQRDTLAGKLEVTNSILTSTDAQNNEWGGIDCSGEVDILGSSILNVGNPGNTIAGLEVNSNCVASVEGSTITNNDIGMKIDATTYSVSGSIITNNRNAGLSFASGSYDTTKITETWVYDNNDDVAAVDNEIISEDLDEPGTNLYQSSGTGSGSWTPSITPDNGIYILSTQGVNQLDVDIDSASGNEYSFSFSGDGWHHSAMFPINDFNPTFTYTATDGDQPVYFILQRKVSSTGTLNVIDLTSVDFVTESPNINDIDEDGIANVDEIEEYIEWYEFENVSRNIDENSLKINGYSYTNDIPVWSSDEHILHIRARGSVGDEVITFFTDNYDEEITLTDEFDWYTIDDIDLYSSLIGILTSSTDIIYLDKVAILPFNSEVDYFDGIHDTDTYVFESDSDFDGLNDFAEKFVFSEVESLSGTILEKGDFIEKTVNIPEQSIQSYRVKAIGTAYYAFDKSYDGNEDYQNNLFNNNLAVRINGQTPDPYSESVSSDGIDVWEEVFEGTTYTSFGEPILSMEISPSIINLNDETDFTVTVTNSGTITATGVTVTGIALSNPAAQISDSRDILPGNQEVYYLNDFDALSLSDQIIFSATSDQGVYDAKSIVASDALIDVSISDVFEYDNLEIYDELIDDTFYPKVPLTVIGGTISSTNTITSVEYAIDDFSYYQVPDSKFDSSSFNFKLPDILSGEHVIRILVTDIKGNIGVTEYTYVKDMWDTGDISIVNTAEMQKEISFTLLKPGGLILSNTPVYLVSDRANDVITNQIGTTDNDGKITFGIQATNYGSATVTLYYFNEGISGNPLSLGDNTIFGLNQKIIETEITFEPSSVDVAVQKTKDDAYAGKIDWNEITITTTSGGSPVSNVPFTIESDYPENVEFETPVQTDASGQAIIKIRSDVVDDSLELRVRVAGNTYTQYMEFTEGACVVEKRYVSVYLRDVYNDNVVRFDLAQIGSDFVYYEIDEFIVEKQGLRPLIPDADNDGLTDGEEAKFNSNSNYIDTDGDGANDEDEFDAGTDPNAVDSDNDGLDDDIEILTEGLDPLNPDSDGDGVLDGDEDKNDNELFGAADSEADPRNTDLDSDLIPDGWDTDGDSLPDGWEILYGLNPANSADGAYDNDGDTLTNIQEREYGTNPLRKDSDSDGINDGLEVYYGLQPMDTDSDDDGVFDGAETNWDEDTDESYDKVGFEVNDEIYTFQDLDDDGEWDPEESLDRDYDSNSWLARETNDKVFNILIGYNNGEAYIFKDKNGNGAYDSDETVFDHDIDRNQNPTLPDLSDITYNYMIGYDNAGDDSFIFQDENSNDDFDNGVDDILDFDFDEDFENINPGSVGNVYSLMVGIDKDNELFKFQSDDGNWDVSDRIIDVDYDNNAICASPMGVDDFYPLLVGSDSGELILFEDRDDNGLWTDSSETLDLDFDHNNVDGNTANIAGTEDVVYIGHDDMTSSADDRIEWYLFVDDGSTSGQWDSVDNVVFDDFDKNGVEATQRSTSDNVYRFYIGYHNHREVYAFVDSDNDNKWDTNEYITNLDVDNNQNEASPTDQDTGYKIKVGRAVLDQNERYLVMDITNPNVWNSEDIILNLDYDGNNRYALPSTSDVYNPLINALDLDSDNDGVLDGNEWLWINKNNMVDTDSDGDTIWDGIELSHQDDIDNDGLPNFLDTDSDNDGLGDEEEDTDADGSVDFQESSPVLVDTDNDGLTDYNEVHTYETYAYDIDTDDDSLTDYQEIIGYSYLYQGIPYIESYLISTESDITTISDANGVLFRTNAVVQDPESTTQTGGYSEGTWILLLNTLYGSSLINYGHVEDINQNTISDAQEEFPQEMFGVPFIHTPEGYPVFVVPDYIFPYCIAVKTTPVTSNSGFEFYGMPDFYPLEADEGSLYEIGDETDPSSGKLKYQTIFNGGSIELRTNLIWDYFWDYLIFHNPVFPPPMGSAGPGAAILPNSWFKYNHPLNSGPQLSYYGYIADINGNQINDDAEFQEELFGTPFRYTPAGQPLWVYNSSVPTNPINTYSEFQQNALIAIDYVPELPNLGVAFFGIPEHFPMAYDDVMESGSMDQIYENERGQFIQYSVVYEENNLHRVETSSSPLLEDTDNDGLPDSVEYLVSDASDVDSDGDGLDDYLESRIILRTSGDYQEESSWIALLPSGQPTGPEYYTLEFFGYIDELTTAPSPITQLTLQTPEGYNIYSDDVDSTLIYIELSPSSYLKYMKYGNQPSYSMGSDYVEIRYYGTDFLDIDSDDDGLPDGAIDGWQYNSVDGWFDDRGETNELLEAWEGENYQANSLVGDWTSSPLSIDTDSDGILDALEYYYKAQFTDFETSGFDADDLALWNLYNIEVGTPSSNGAIYPDIDGDGEYNPNDADSDNDGIPDGEEDSNLNGVWDGKTLPDAGKTPFSITKRHPFFKEVYETCPYLWDSDLDGLADGDQSLDFSTYTGPMGWEGTHGHESSIGTRVLDWDSDNDLLLDGYNGYVSYPGENRNNNNQIGNDEPDPTDRDSDDDGVIDGIEYYFIKGVRETLHDATPNLNNGYYDSDGDGILDLKEVDSDNDGLSDGEENFNFDDDLDYFTENGYTYYTEADPTDWDSDNDHLLDGAEASWTDDIDGDDNDDLFINVWDQDSNVGSGTIVDNYYIEKPSGGKYDYDDMYVLFRTDAVDTDDDGNLNYVSDTWIVLDPIEISGSGYNDITTVDLTLDNGEPTSPPVLVSYEWFGSSTSTPTVVNIYTYYKDDHSKLYTPEGYTVYLEDGVNSDDAKVYIEISSSDYQIYKRPKESGVVVEVSGSERSNKPMPTGEGNDQTAYSGHNYIAQHQETYDPSIVIDMDMDGDGLTNDVEQHYITLGKLPSNAMYDADCDDDGIMDGDEPLWMFDSDNDGLINANDPDSDDDDLMDGTEMGVTVRNRGTDPTSSNFVADADPDTLTDMLDDDTDDDGITDGDEDYNDDRGSAYDHNGKYDQMSETDPLNHDSDFDGIPDGSEITTLPYDCDTDDDGISDGDELALGTNPLLEDTDGDTIPDGIEVGLTQGLSGFNDQYLGTEGVFTADADPMTTTRPKSTDSDGDGLLDNLEDADQNGKVDLYETDPNLVDSDNDKINDGVEGLVNTDGDAFVDALDLDSDGDGLSDQDEYFNLTTDAYNWDTDGDLLADGEISMTFVGIGCPDDVCLSEAEFGTNPVKDDTDGDSLLDGDEVYSVYGYDTDPNSKDSDGDDIFDNLEIQRFSTNPMDPDTDIDGFSDGSEVFGWTRAITYYVGDTEDDLRSVERTVFSNPKRDETQFMDVDKDGILDYIEADPRNVTIPWVVEYINNHDDDSISAQFNPNSVENLPPDIYNIDISSKLIWKTIKIKIKLGPFSWGYEAKTIPDHAVSIIEVDVKDVPGAEFIEISVLDRHRTERLYRDINNHYKASIDINYEDYLNDYKVKIYAIDINLNDAYDKKDIDGIIGWAVEGIVSFFTAIGEGLKSLANFALEWLKKYVYERILEFFGGIFDTIKEAVKDVGTALYNCIHMSFENLEAGLNCAVTLIFFGTVLMLLTALTAVITAIFMFTTEAASPIAGWVLNIVVGMIVASLLSIVLAKIFDEDLVDDVVPEWIPGLPQKAFTLMAVIVGIGLKIADIQRQRTQGYALKSVQKFYSRALPVFILTTIFSQGVDFVAKRWDEDTVEHKAKVLISKILCLGVDIYVGLDPKNEFKIDGRLTWRYPLLKHIETAIVVGGTAFQVVEVLDATVELYNVAT